MRNYVYLLSRYAIDFLEETFPAVGHHNEAVGEFIQLPQSMHADPYLARAAWCAKPS
jgi:hypothetical protein